MHATNVQAVEPRSMLRVAETEWQLSRPGNDREASWLPPVSVQAVLTAAPLLAADLLAALTSFALAWQMAGILWPAAAMDPASLAAGFAIAICLANLAVGLYPGTGLGPIAEIRLSGLAAALIAVIFMMVSLADSRLNVPVQLAIAATCTLLLFASPLARSVVRTVFGRFDWWGQPALIVGECAAAESLYSLLQRNPRLGVRPLGIVTDWREADHHPAPSYLLGPLSRASAVVRDLGDPWLIVVMPACPGEDVERLLSSLGGQGRGRTVISDLVGPPSVLSRANGCLELSGRCEPASGAAWPRLVKRAIDVALAIVAAMLLAPLLVALVALVRLSSAGPVFYCHQRIGHRGNRFQMWKFRTMVANADLALKSYLDANPKLREEWNRDHKLQNDPRITRIGRWMRKTSLDELPQLWNVLKGDMSLVGPRPIVTAEIARYGPHFHDLCSVPPGVTGLWQVSGRNDTTYAERIELDSYYARHWSVWLDLYILLRTVKVVLFRQGAY